MEARVSLKYFVNGCSPENVIIHLMGRVNSQEGAKATLQILAKRCVFIAAFKWETSRWNEFQTDNLVRKKPWIL